MLDLEVVATEDAAECRVGVREPGQAGWLQVSTDGGTTYDAVPAAGAGAIPGPDLGPLTAGQRKAIELKVAIPSGTSVRTRSIEPVLGFGI